MGYDTSVVLARGAGLAGLEEALGGGYRPTGKVVGFQEASAKKLGKALAVTTLDPWLVVWDPGLVTLRTKSALDHLSGSGRALGLLLGEVSGTYALSAYARGRSVRQLAFTEGVKAQDTGEALPEEAASPSLTAEGLLALAARVLEQPLTRLQEARYALWKPTPVPKGAAGDSFKRARRAFKEEEEERALEHARLACRLAPDVAAVRALAATYADNLHLHEETLSHTERALALDESAARLWKMRGEALRVLGRLNEALESHARAAAMDPLGAEAWFEQAALLLEQGRESEAHEARAQALRVGPAVGALYAERAFRHSLFDQWAQAAAVARRALRLVADPDLESVLAHALMNLGEDEAALAACARALALRPAGNFPYEQPTWLSARILARQGRADAALDALRQALSQAPHLARRAARDAAFESLRGDPRFEALLAGPPTR
jgi:tetratricopeptide (TPR) repeat protein